MLGFIVHRNASLSICFGRRFSLSSVFRSDFVGRDFVEPTAMTAKEWKEILWTAMDLKQLSKERGKNSLDFLANKHVTGLFFKPNARHSISFSLACQILGARHTLIMDSDFESQPSVIDGGRIISRLTDAIVVSGLQQPNLLKIAEGSIVPVIGCSSSVYNMQRTLADLMTFQEIYGRLKRLTLAWVGPTTPACNSYICMLPLFGISIKFVCVCSQGSGSMTPIKYQDGLIACRSSSAELHQFQTVQEATYRADIIACSAHPDENNKITIKLLDEAAINWSFIHSMPRTDVEVEDNVFLHKNNITWRSTENYVYVAMALLLRCLRCYEPKIQMPQFDGPL